MPVEHFIWTRRRTGYGYLLQPEKSKTPMELRHAIETIMKGGLLPRDVGFFRAIALHHFPPEWVVVFIVHCGRELTDHANGRPGLRFVHALTLPIVEFYQRTSSHFLDFILDIQSGYARFSKMSGVWASADIINEIIRTGQVDGSVNLSRLSSELNTISWESAERGIVPMDCVSHWQPVKSSTMSFFVANALLDREPHAAMLETAFRIASQAVEQNQTTRFYMDAVSYRYNGDFSIGDTILIPGKHFVAMNSQSGMILSINSSEEAVKSLHPSSVSSSKKEDVDTIQSPHAAHGSTVETEKVRNSFGFDFFSSSWMQARDRLAKWFGYFSPSTREFKQTRSMRIAAYSSSNALLQPAADTAESFSQDKHIQESPKDKNMSYAHDSSTKRLAQPAPNGISSASAVTECAYEQKLRTWRTPKGNVSIDITTRGKFKRIGIELSAQQGSMDARPYRRRRESSTKPESSGGRSNEPSRNAKLVHKKKRKKQ